MTNDPHAASFGPSPEDATTFHRGGPRTVRATVVQAGSVLLDAPRTLQKLADLTSDAAALGADVVVFPEAFVGGYPKGWDFGLSVGSRTPAGRELFRLLYENAVDASGPEVQAIGAAAQAHGVYLVVGAVEREGGTLYCSAFTFGPDGRLLGKRRKLTPTALERTMWGSGDGSTLDVADTHVGRLGAVICWENYMPLLRTAMYARGIELYCALTVDDRDAWQSSMTHVALEGRCFVLSACQYLGRDDLPAGWPLDRLPPAPAAAIRGGSCIVDPLGRKLAGPVYGEERLLTADLDREELARARFDFDAVGHYARPDVFTLSVDERPRASVVFRRAEPS